MTSSAPKAQAERNAYRAVYPILCLILLALIFATSCTVIRPQEFFELIATYTGADQGLMRRFAVFWGLTWFAIVKGWHFTEFALLTLFSVRALRWWRGTTTTSTIVAAMVFCFVFAVSDELHQSFIPIDLGPYRMYLSTARAFSLLELCCFWCNGTAESNPKFAIRRQEHLGHAIRAGLSS